VIFNNCHLLMTLMIGLHPFLEMSKKCWPRFRVRNSTYRSRKNDFLGTLNEKGNFTYFQADAK
jgi:hypothetical protein